MTIWRWVDKRIERVLAEQSPDRVVGEKSQELSPELPIDELKTSTPPIQVQVVEPEAPGLLVHRRDNQRALTSEDPELAALLNEQTLLTQRDNVLVGAILTLVSVGALLLSFYLSQFPRLCSAFSDSDVGFSERCISNENVYLLAPLPVLAVAGILVFLTLNSHITASLLHKVESALQLKVDFELAPDVEKGEVHSIRLPSSNSLIGLIFSGKRAKTLRVYQASNFVTLVAIIGLVFGLLVPVMGRVSGTLQWVTLGIYGPPFLVLFVAFYRSAFFSRRVLRDATAAQAVLDERKKDWPLAEGVRWLKRDEVSGRRPIGFLLLPRPTELLFKSQVIAVSIVLARFAAGGEWTGRWNALVAVAAFEGLLYQARYMLNDAVDYEVDRSNPRPEGKGRCPYMGRQTRTVVRIAALGRLALFSILVLTALPASVGTPVAVAAGCVLVLMGFYDRFSEFSRERWGLGPSTDLAGRPSDSSGWIQSVSPVPATIRLILVAPGYAIRAVLGVAIALDGWPHWQAIVAIGLALGAMEAANVALAWIAEGAGNVSSDGSRYRIGLGRRPHMGWLLRNAGVVNENSRVVVADGVAHEDDLAASAVLVTTSRINGPRLWNLWMAISLTSGAVAGVLLNNRLSPIDHKWLVVALLSFVPACLLLVRVSGRVPSVLSPANWMIVPAWLGVALVAHWVSSQIAESDESIQYWPSWVLISLLSALYAASRLTTYEAYLGTVKQLVAVAIQIMVRLALLPRYVVGFFLGADLFPKRLEQEKDENPLARVYPVLSLGEALAVVTELRLDHCIFDLENTLGPYSSNQSKNDPLAHTPLPPQVALVVSNARWTKNLESVGGCAAIGLARKPFTRKSKIDDALNHKTIDAVVGDQVLTDGLLAMRLGVPFVHVDRQTSEEPAWPRLMRKVGNLVLKLIG